MTAVAAMAGTAAWYLNRRLDPWPVGSWTQAVRDINQVAQREYSLRGGEMFLLRRSPHARRAAEAPTATLRI